jgi:hypothetical protein
VPHHCGPVAQPNHGSHFCSRKAAPPKLGACTGTSANTWSFCTSFLAAASPLAASWPSSSAPTNSIFRPLTPPSALARSNLAFAPISASLVE